MCRSSGTLITIRYATHTGSRPTRVYTRAYDVSPLPFSFVPIKQIIIIFVLGIKKFNELTKNGG